MDCLIVFAKAPMEGKVKTRLQSGTPLSPSDICFLYRAFLDDVLVAAGKSAAQRIMLCFTPAFAEEQMKNIALEKIAPERLLLHPQEGDAFHERIGHAFARAREAGAQNCVMIGSDSPTLSAEKLDRAFLLLKANGAALGPSGEGGLYLIGLAPGVHPDFQKIFGGGAELANFSGWLKKNAVPFSLLEEVTDVDVSLDLVTIIAHVAAMKAAGNGHPRNTARALEALNLAVASENGTRGKKVVKHG